MKFCTHCGKQINDEAVVCTNCGCPIKENSLKSKEHNESKTGIGVLCALFLGIIGLIIGICIYPNESNARKTFLKGWGITFGVCAGIILMVYLALIIFIFGASGIYYH